MKKQTLTKIKMKNRDDHRYLKTKDNTITVCRKAVLDCQKSSSIEVKCRPKAFFRNVKYKLNFKNAISDLVDSHKIVSADNDKAKEINMFFKSVFRKKSDCPDFKLKVKSSIEHVSSFLRDKIKKKLKNDRQISLTFIVCKIMESIVKDDTLAYMVKSNLLTNLQHGFVHGKNC